MSERNSRRPSFRASFWIGAAALVAAAASSAGCNTTVDPPQLSSLRRSGQVSFLCIGPDGAGAPLSRCPQGPRLVDGGLTVARPGYELHALVTQTATAEVAVVRITGQDANGRSTGRVLDADSTNPGVTPLRVGQQPVDIVTTPGGEATFVGVAESGRQGIFALPTSCIFEPSEGETKRDLTTWPACSLSSAPGEMVVVVDPADASGNVRASCDGPYEAPAVPGPAGAGECRSDLSREAAPLGRRKLIVALPDEGRLVVLDAQSLLNRPQGSFERCVFEEEHPLEVRLPSRILQPLPDDLVVPGCSEAVKEYGPFDEPFRSRPSGIDERDGLMVVGDQTAPVVHLISTVDPCALDEYEPLVATSLTDPARIVTTSRVAVSPETPDGKQYVYAVDEVGEKVASIMVFDVSVGQASRTPLVRPGAAEMPLEPADRIEFLAPAKDVAFALVDRPEIDPVTGTAAVGTRCDPDPSTDPNSPGARYRPNLDDETGARPKQFRGLFGYVLLANGAVALVDIDDFDADCRRPVAANARSTNDFRGCRSDPKSPAYYTADGQASSTPTVTDEVSCRVVEPHRARSANLLITSEDNGTVAPSLRSFARLSRNGRGLAVSRAIAAGRQSPMMLGVDFEGSRPGTSVPAQVFVGNQLYTNGDSQAPLVISPKLAEQPSVVLPFVEPRAYPTSEIVTVTFEGDLKGIQQTGLLEAKERVLQDEQALFCNMGVQSVELTAELGQTRFGLPEDLAQEFGRRHGDYVQITNNLRLEADPYWDGNGAVCAEISGNSAVGGFAACDGLFGDGVVATTMTTTTTTVTPVTNTTPGATTPGTVNPGTGTTTPVRTTTTTTAVTTTTTTTTSGDDLVAARDFRILRAYQERLEIEPRFARGDAADQLVAMLECCFPDVLSYKVRAGNQWVVKGESTGFRHSVVSSPVTVDGKTEYMCVQDCSPLRASEQGRAFEISATDCPDPDPENADYCPVGPRTEDDLICAYAARRGPVSPGGVASECIFDGQTRRLAVYRGLSPSERGMSFGFEVIGGFVSQTVPLTDATNRVILPVSLTAIPSFGQLAVVDSQNRGLMMIDLQVARVADSFF